MKIDKNTEALLKGIIGVDEAGAHYIRVVNKKGVSLENAVSTKSPLSLSVLLNKCVVLDENGQPALNLAVVNFGQTVGDKTNADRKKSIEAETSRKKEIDKEYTDRRDTLKNKKAKAKKAKAK